MNEDARRQRLNEIRQITNRLSGEGLEAGRNKKESTDYFKQRDLFWPDDAPGMPRTFVRVLRPGQSDVTSYFATATPREVDRAAKRKIKIGEDTVAVGRIEELQANYLMQEDHAQLDEEIFEIQERRRPSDDESEQETQGERT